MSDEIPVGNFVKLYGSIVTSSVWSESAPTRIVWLTMLAIADVNGGVAGAVPGLARIANVTVPECEAAIKVLSDPDPYSKTPDNDGRRIKSVAGGWLVLNYKLYRELRTPKQVHEAERKAEWRERQKEAPNGRDNAGQSRMSHTEVEVEGEVETDNNNTPPRARAWPEAVENFLRSLKSAGPWEAEFKMWLDGGRELAVTMADIESAVTDYVGNGERPNLMAFRAYLRRAYRARTAPQTATPKGGDDAEFVRASTALLNLVEKRDPLHPHTLTPEGWQLVNDRQRQALKAIGGIDRVLTAKPDQWPFVVRDFLKAQRGAAA